MCRPYSTLTLVKNLINDNGGNATLDQFILTATAGDAAAIINGPDPDAALDSGIGAAVPAGDYTLAETTLAGYAASSWVCTGGTVTGSTVTVTDGADVVCVVTNDDQVVDLQLTKSDGGATAVAGGPAFDYTLTIDNVGTRDAQTGEPVVVTDQLPVGMVYASFPSNCSVLGQTLTCTLDPADLQVADPAIVITVTVRLAANAPSGTYTNKAYVTTADDPACVGDACVPPCTTEQGGQAANNTDCEDTPSTCEATISVTKTDSVDTTVQVGEGYSYAIVVTNNGPSTVTNVTLSDVLPGRPEPGERRWDGLDLQQHRSVGVRLDRDVGCRRLDPRSDGEGRPWRVVQRNPSGQLRLRSSAGRRQGHTQHRRRRHRDRPPPPRPPRSRPPWRSCRRRPSCRPR